MLRRQSNGGSQTVDRALAVLGAVVMREGPVPLDQVASLVGLHRSVVYRLLRSLEAAGYMLRDAVAGGYSAGPVLLSMSVSIANRIDVRSVVRPAMERIVREFGETASLHLRSGNQRVCIEVVDGTHPVRRMVPIGEAHPLHAGETGRALLSGMTSAELELVMATAANAGVDSDQLLADIEHVRAKGWFVGLGTRTPDVGSISIPIRGLDGALHALTVSGPASRWGDDNIMAALPKIEEILRPVKEQLAAA